jgi:hypothetical protein
MFTIEQDGQSYFIAGGSATIPLPGGGNVVISGGSGATPLPPSTTVVGTGGTPVQTTPGFFGIDPTMLLIILVGVIAVAFALR